MTEANDREYLEATADVETKDSAEALLGEAEPWESWETQLVGWSIGIGIVGLIVLSWLINTFVLFNK